MRQLLPTPSDEADLVAAYDDPGREPSDDRPYVLLNMVASTDGAFTVEGRTAPLSSAADRALFHLLRTFVDVVLVGAQTVRVEGYGPPKVSDEQRVRRVERGQTPAPRMAVVTRHLDLDPGARFFTGDGERPLLLVPGDAAADVVARFEPAADVVQAGTGGVDLRAALGELRQRGVRTVLCEGGPTLNGELARAGAIDELCLTVAPELVGGGGGSGLLGRVHLDATMGLSLVHALEEDDHLFLRYRTAGAWPEPAPDDPAATDEVTVDAFHDAVGDLDYPMMIVTATDGTQRSGCLVGFGAQCSIAPPRFMVWLSKRNHTYRVAQRADVLVVHFPSTAPADVELAELFGTTTGDEVDKFSRCRWSDGPGGAPVLDGVARWFAGSVTERFDSGDHVAFMLAPVDGRSGEWPGQLGFQAVKDFTPGHAP